MDQSKHFHHPFFSRLIALLTLGLFAGFFSSHALAGADFSGCRVDGKNIETVVDESIRSISEVKKSGNNLKIVVNPYSSYFGWETMRWLYLRQCGHIELKHISAKSKNSRGSVRQEGLADCWAARRLIKTEGLGARQLKTIERDIQRMSPDEKLSILGAQRRIDLSYCLKK